MICESMPCRAAACKASTDRALSSAGMELNDLDIFELHDAYTIMACLSLESAGFMPRGEGPKVSLHSQLFLQLAASEIVAL
jgi:acetyl-CoA C-acetyltransferase